MQLATHDQHYPEWGGPGQATQSCTPPQAGAPQTRGCESSPRLSWSHKLALSAVLVKNVWFHFLYSYKEKNCVCFTVYMAGPMYFEQFYCFPLKNHFLGEAGETPRPSCPVPSPDCAAARSPPPTPPHLRLTTERVGSQFSSRLLRDQGYIRPWPSLQGTEAEQRQSLLSWLGDGCRAACSAPGPRAKGERRVSGKGQGMCHAVGKGRRTCAGSA